jgi:ATP-binding cassette subfamily F protein 3
MIFLTCRELSRQFDVDPVFRDVTFDVRAGEKIGLVGPNGTGKTTLLRILAGHDEPDTGHVERHSGSSVAILEQDARFETGRTLIAEAKSGLAHLYDLQHQALDLAEQMAKASDDKEQARLHKRYDDIQHELEKHDAYHIDHRVDEVLIGLGFSKDDYDRPLESFSGGQKNRVLLARLLLRAPDVMLLDEPTNHLDIAATEWLEAWLAKSEQAVILVSHDRYFLDRVTTRILEMHQARITDFKGNFSAYWQQREERAKVLERTYEKQQEFIARTEDFIRRNKYGQKHAQATDREKKLERLDRVEQISDFQQFAMGFAEPTRSGDWVIDAVDISKGFGGDPLFRNFTLRINREDRIGILGPNGSGKTTLLRTLIGELKPDTGTVRLGTNVKIAYYDQQLNSVDPTLDAVEAIRPLDNPHITPGTLRSILARFGIRGEQAFQEVGSMSGGERSKVALAKIAAMDVNVLILDEPTNHLDLWARSSLEDTLKTYKGTILFVSHDRYFLDRVAQSVIVLDLGDWKYYEGNYSDYVGFTKNRLSELPAETPKAIAAKIENPPEPEPDSRRKKEPKRKRKFPYRKVSDLETEIAEYEELVERLQTYISDPEIYRDGERVR